jgi:putative peptidoglycan lipid II flippase
VVSRSWGIAFATLISRVTGFARFVLLAAILGAALTSAFSVANQLPNLVAALVLEATFTAVFVPVLARAEREDPDGGTAFVRRLVTLATTLLLITTVLSVVAAPILVRLMLGSDATSKVDESLTTAFAYLLLPQVLFYGLSSVFMAILNNRNMFGAPAWAPVVNNVVALLTLGVYVFIPGDLSAGHANAKLLVLGVGTTLGVVAQAAVLLIAIGRQRISLRPLWGIDDRLKQFGMMAAAMVLYVMISQFGLVVGNQIASWAADSGPAIYNYTWLVLMLPFGLIGVTVLTVVMPRLSRNAAANDLRGMLADLGLATRLTMVTLIPITAFMTVGGSAMGSALFAYGNFGSVDAGYLGTAIALSAFTLIPYALVLLQLRVFYARHQPWTPILIIVVITSVKIGASLVVQQLAVHDVIANPQLVAGFLGTANGLGFLAGATVGYFLLRRSLAPPGGMLFSADVLRTVLVTVSASLLAGLVAYVADRLLHVNVLTERFGGGGSLVRLALLGLIMVPIIAAVMLAARVPEAHSVLGAVRRRLGRSPARSIPVRAESSGYTSYPEQRLSHMPRPRPGSWPVQHGQGRVHATAREGTAVTDETPGSADATTRLTRPVADDFQPDVSSDTPVERSAPPRVRVPAGDFAGDPTREVMGMAAPSSDASGGDDVPLMPGVSISDGRYRLLVDHGGPDGLRFWQALDTALDRQVALTFVDPDGRLPSDQLQEILSRTLRLSRISLPGVAGVLDVVRVRAGGLIVSEWIRGGSLREVADTSPSPIGAARAMQSLAAAADAAHAAGVALSVDHPSRIRVSIEGDVALAFPATLPTASPEDDIRGIGAALYALLLNRWPLPEGGERSGLAPADVDGVGNPVEPKAVDHQIPFQVSAAAVRSIQRSGGIASASTLLTILQQATAEADRTELISPVETVSPPPARVKGGGGLRRWSELDEDERARRRKGLLIGLSVVGAILVVAALLAAALFHGFDGDYGTKEDKYGLHPSSEAAAPDNAGASVKPDKATSWAPGGSPDNPEQAPLAIDGNPATAWKTVHYDDKDPFPAAYPGVGLILHLPKPTVLSSVDLTVNSTGTQVQLRSSSSDTPTALDDTSELTKSQPMQPGANTIKIDNAQPTSNLVVLITKLGSTGSDSHAEIADITLKAQS